MAPYTPPKSILIIGSGVFGLGTAEALLRRPAFAHTTITVVDRGSGDHVTDEAEHFPARDSASIDSSRIIRPDYADAAYAALADEAMDYWRGHKKRAGDEGGGIGGDGRYTESGLVLVADRNPRDGLYGGDHSKKKTGMDYVRESWNNVLDLAANDPATLAKIKELPNPEAIRQVVGTGGTTGDWGYINATSGWANAEKSMRWVYDQVRRLDNGRNRIQFVRGRVAGLDIDTTTQRVRGVVLEDGRRITADLTVAAAGAWTESLLGVVPDMRVAGTMSATGQAIGYVPFANAAERQRICHMPVVLNLSTGLFIIPPAPDSAELKVARHAYGYLRPTDAASSTPLTHLDDPALQIPPEGAADLRRGLHAMVPGPDGLAARPFSRTRICWYTDTADADFVVDYHPRWQGLFVATGGSGHAFKFLPVIGDKVVDCISGNCPAAFRSKWAWKDGPADATASKNAPISVVCDDGSRGGQPGLLLQEELAKANKAKI